MKRVASGRRMNGATDGLLRSFVLWVKNRPADDTQSANPPPLRLPAAFPDTKELVRALEAVRSTEPAYPLPDPRSSKRRASAEAANDTVTNEPSAPEPTLSSQPIGGASEQVSRAAHEVARAVERLVEPEPWRPAKALPEATDQVRPDHNLPLGQQTPALHSQGPGQPRLRIHPLLRASQEIRGPAPVASPALPADEPPARTQALPLTIAPTPIGERFHEPSFPNYPFRPLNPEPQPDAPSRASDAVPQPMQAPQPQAVNKAPTPQGPRFQAPSPADAPFFRTIPTRAEDAVAPLERGAQAVRFARSQPTLPQLYRTPMLEPFSLAEPEPDPAGGSWFGFFSVLYPVLAFAIFAAVKLVLSAHEPGPVRPAPEAASRTGMQSGDMLSAAPARDGIAAAAAARPLAKLAGEAGVTPALAPMRPQAEPDPPKVMAENSGPLPRTATLDATDFAQAADVFEPTSSEVPPAPAPVEMSTPQDALTSPGRAEPSPATATIAAVPDADPHPDPNTASAREPKAVNGAAPPSARITTLDSIEPAPNAPAGPTPRQLLPATGPGGFEAPATSPGDEIAPQNAAQPRSDVPNAEGATLAEQGKFAVPTTALSAPAAAVPSVDLAATTGSDRAAPAEVLPPAPTSVTRATAPTVGAAMITESTQLAPGGKTPALVSEPMGANTRQAQQVSKSADLSDGEHPTRATQTASSVAPASTDNGVALGHGETRAPDLPAGIPAARRVDLSEAGRAPDPGQLQGASAQSATIAPLRGALSPTPKTEKIAPVAMMPPAPSARSGAGLVEASRGGAAAPTSPSGSAAGAKSVGTLSAPTAAAGALRCSESRPSSRKLAPNELASLLKGGREFMQNGNLAAARLMFQRAAEACDKDAAFALGGTYDPNMLQKLGIRRLAANIAIARSWYESARQLGSEEAAAQLELLGNVDH
jgi:hypothetical protein